MAEELLAVAGLRKTWPGGPTLSYPDLRLEQGGLHVLAGANGAGKTTLLRMLCGLESPDGTWAATWRGTKRAVSPVLGQDATYLHQQPYVFATTVGAHLCWGRPANRALLDEVLHDHALLKQQDKLLRELSGGMHKQCCLAALALTSMPLVLLDEPLAGLDDAGTAFCMRMIERMRSQGRAVVVATQQGLDLDIPGAIRIDLQQEPA